MNALQIDLILYGERSKIDKFQDYWKLYLVPKSQKILHGIVLLKVCDSSNE